MKRIAVFASGEGTNLQALLDACAANRVRGQVALVVSNNDDAGALRRAKRAGVDTLVAHQRDFPTAEEYNAFLAHECKRREIDLICLAGFMLLLKAPLLKAFPWRIMNIHPALLPAFGGKGMFGRHVHEAVIKSGARVAAAPCTSSINLRPAATSWPRPGPILPSDTPEALVRVRGEHWFILKRGALLRTASKSPTRHRDSPLA